MVSAFDADHITHHHIHLRDAVHLRVCIPPGTAQYLHRLGILHLIEHIEFVVGLHFEDETHARRKQDCEQHSNRFEQQAPVARSHDFVTRYEAREKERNKQYNNERILELLEVALPQGFFLGVGYLVLSLTRDDGRIIDRKSHFEVFLAFIHSIFLFSAAKIHHIFNNSKFSG